MWWVLRSLGPLLVTNGVFVSRLVLSTWCHCILVKEGVPDGYHQGQPVSGGMFVSQRVTGARTSSDRLLHDRKPCGCCICWVGNRVTGGMLVLGNLVTGGMRVIANLMTGCMPWAGNLVTGGMLEF